MTGARHPLGFCTCKTHSARPWDRSEHWTAAEVAYLEAGFGRVPDEKIARHLGRSVVGMRLKAKRLGLVKRDAGLTARSIAAIFGVDESTVSKRWIRRHGLLRAARSYRKGPHAVHLVDEDELLRFIDEHGEWVDVARMPDSAYRDRALAGGRWYSLPQAARMAGRHPDALAADMRRGRFGGRGRGVHWYVHESVLPDIAATAGYAGRHFDEARYERLLEHHRNVRKGIEEPRPLPLRRVA